MTSSRSLIVHSRNRIRPLVDTASNCIINLTQPLEDGTYTLQEFYLPITFYPIDTNNNSLSVDIAGTTYTGTIVPGIYTVSTLPAAVKASLDAACIVPGITFTVTYSATTMKLTITASAGNFSILGSITTNSGWEMLGFSAQDTAQAVSHTGDMIVNLLKTLHVTVHIDQASGRFIDSKGSSTTFIIPVTNMTGEVLLYRPELGNVTNIAKFNRTNTLNIRLSDDMGNILNLNGAEYYMILGKV